MEVEEEISSHPDVKACVAFSAEHDVLQEVVGICIVMENNRPRLDLPSLHEYLGERLAAPKWPQCLVFMDGLPKSQTNKLLRVKLGSRLGLPEFNDAMPPIERTFQATCPPQGAGLDVPIPTQRVTVSAEDVQSKLRQLLVSEDGSVDEKLFVLHHPTRAGSLICHIYNVDRIKAIEVARQHLDFYEIPTHFVDLENPVDTVLSNATPKATDAVASILHSSSLGPVDALVEAVQEIFADLLKLDYVPGPDANFFHMGGSSMLASQLASKVRKHFDISMNGAEVFHHTSCSEIAKLVRQRSEEYTRTTAADDSSAGNSSIDDHNAPFPSKRMDPQPSFLKSVFQLVPMFVVFPIWQVTRYLLFFCFLLKSIDAVPGDRDIGTFVLAYLVFHLSWVTITPLGFILIKWLVIGRYKKGRYPIYSNYYLRWWFVDIMRKLFLRGIWGSNEALLNCYYRMLGAKIGKGARISLEADVAEFDLVTIGANAAVEFATVRAFGVDNGAMILGPVKLGNDASIGAKSVLAPYTSIPDRGHLGPVTSSYDVGKALDAKHARVNRRCLPEPSLFLQIFVQNPITFLVNGFAAIPPLLVLLYMLQYKGQRGEAFMTLTDLIEWLCDPKRIPFYIGIRVARALLSPFFYMAAAIFVKRTVIGKFEAGPRDTWTEWELLRHDLAATLFSRKKMQGVTDIIGRHYELVSVLYRLLGAKVGKRVFWPGNQPVFTGEFDLLEIGDDVVFGSRSSIFCTTVDSCEKVILCAGSNVADNCVVLPGSIIGKNAVLGSNSVCPEGWYLPANSIWFGSKGCEPDCLDKGAEGIKGHFLSCKVDPSQLQFVGDETTVRPFGKAFYQGKANYFVWPLRWIIFVTVVIKICIAVFHTLPLLGAVHGAAALLFGASFDNRDYEDTHYSFATFYATVLFVYFFTNLIRVGLWLGIELTAKWTLMGRREVGRYNYDTSNYAQRWELYQLIAKIRKFNRLNFLDFFSGTPFLSTYFRLNGGNIGKDCCLYPAGADPFMPEPDLVIMGDRCVVDCASIVCHLNTRGNFELAQITMENDCTLRTRSRIQQAVYMEEGSQLVEKSLAMTGEVIESGTVWQGGPASFWFSYDKMSPGSSTKTVPYANSDLAEDEVYDESAKLLSDSYMYTV
jgi:acetyltransferase-like isoleucine patch superfamily enzyme